MKNEAEINLHYDFYKGRYGENFSIAYNAYKPLSTSLLQYNNVNFYYSGTEFFTQFTNGGLIWILAWGFLGFVIIKMLIKDFNRVKIYKDDLSSSWYLLAFDTIITFIYLSSFVGVYIILPIYLFSNIIWDIDYIRRFKIRISSYKS